MTGRITLIGAGEMMSAMSPLHRAVLGLLREPPRPVFLDTTAGFETNVDGDRRQGRRVLRAPPQPSSASRATAIENGPAAAEIAAAVNEIRDANMIFAGPGSPTYAIKQWRDSPVWDAVVRALRGGRRRLFRQRRLDHARALRPAGLRDLQGRRRPLLGRRPGPAGASMVSTWPWCRTSTTTPAARTTTRASATWARRRFDVLQERCRRTSRSSASTPTRRICFDPDAARRPSPARAASR